MANGNNDTTNNQNNNTTNQTNTTENEKSPQAACQDIILSEDYLDVIEIGVEEGVKGAVCTQMINSQIKVVHIKKQDSCVEDYLKVPYVAIRIPNVFGISGTQSASRLGSDALRNITKSGLTGKDVLIGILDTGIDYTHEAFIYEDSTTKIVSIWDQGRPSQNAIPKGQQYGTEYTREQINEALKAKDPYSIVAEKDENGHGTFIAGLAAGRPKSSERFFSAAPDAELIVVKLKRAKECVRKFFFTGDAVAFQDNDVLTGMKYIYEKARDLAKPVAIIFTGESCIGAHTSADVDPIEIYASDLGKNNGVVMLTSAGNEADKGHHYLGSYRNADGTLSKEKNQQVQFNVAEGQAGMSFSMWVKEPDRVTVGLTSPQGSKTGRVQYKSNIIQEFTFITEETTIVVDYVYRQRFGGQQAIHFRIDKPTPGIWAFNIYGDEIITGQYNIWLPVSSFMQPDTRFLQPNPNITVVTPSTSESTISIGAYDSVYSSIYSASGRGFTADNSVKPDVVDNGVNLAGPVPGNKYGAMSGTFAATAIATGSVALLLEWGIVKGNDVAIDTVLAKSYLIGGARRKSTITYPSKEWGYGEVDIVSTIQGHGG